MPKSTFQLCSKNFLEVLRVFVVAEAPDRVLLAIFALLALVLPLRTRRFATPILALVIGFAATGCDGCYPHGSPGPLRPDENTRFYLNDRLASTAPTVAARSRPLAHDLGVEEHAFERASAPSRETSNNATTVPGRQYPHR